MSENMPFVRQIFAGVINGLFMATSDGLLSWDPVADREMPSFCRLTGYEANYKAILYNFTLDRGNGHKVLLTNANEALMIFPSTRHKLDNIRYATTYDNCNLICANVSGELFHVTEQGVSVILHMSL